MSIRRMQNVLINGKKSTLELFLGDRWVGDKCYARIYPDKVTWFEPSSFSKELIIAQGKEVLKKMLEGTKVTFFDEDIL